MFYLQHYLGRRFCPETDFNFLRNYENVLFYWLFMNVVDILLVMKANRTKARDISRNT